MIHPPSEDQYANTARRSAEDKAASFTAQSLLVDRQKKLTNLTDMEWVDKYSDAFRDLFGSDDAFVDAVRTAASKKSDKDAVEAALAGIQAKLDERLTDFSK